MDNWNNWASLFDTLLFTLGELCGRSPSTTLRVLVLEQAKGICDALTICGGSKGRENADKITTVAAERAVGNTPPCGHTIDHDKDSSKKNLNNIGDTSVVLSINLLFKQIS